MIGNFKDVTEIHLNRFAESPLGRQLEGMDFDNIDNTDDSSLDAYVNDVPDDLCDDNGEETDQEQLDGVGGEKNDAPEKKGGSYSDVKATSDGETHEVHHIPADSASPLDRNDGPAIKMEKEDHRQTASYGNSADARAYREKQKELINAGNFREAMQMDIDDIHDKFGDKYDDAIEEMLDYVDQIEEEGKIND